MANTEDSDEISLLDLAIVLAKHKWLIIGLPFVAAVVAAIISLLMPNIYTATTRLVLPQQSQSAGAAMLGQLGGLPGIASGALGIKNPGDLYIGMLKSRTLADGLIDRFKLMERFNAKYASDARNRLAGISRFVSGKDGIIAIEVDHEDPQFAAELANAYVDGLLKLTNTLAVTEAGQRRLFFERQLKQARGDLVKAEIDARSALQQGGVAMVDEQGKSMITVIAGLRAQIAVKEVQITAMGGFAAEQNPSFIQARQELAALKQQLAKLEGYGVSSRAMTGGKDGAQGLKNVSLLRDLKFNEVMVEMLTKQYELAKVEEAKDAVVVQVLDPAIPPDRKSKPQRTLIVLLSILAAGIVAIFLAFMSEAFANAHQDPQTSERLLRLRRYLAWR